MARYDKYEPLVSGTRAKLANDWLESDLDKVVGVGLNNRGAIVKGAGASGIVGVLVLTRVIRAGQEVVDIMKRGEIVEFHKAGRPLVELDPATTPGTKYYVGDDGVVAAGPTDGTAATGAYVGHTVERDRLVVSMGV